MKKTFFQWTAAAWAIVLLGCVTASAQTPAPLLYGITFGGNQLITIDPTNGDATLVGTINANVNGYGLATRNGLLYSFSGNGDLIYEINPTNASVIRSLSIGVTNLSGEGDLAFRSDGAGFLATAFTSGTNLNATNGLYIFDVVGGSAQLIATTSITIDALAFDSGNTLYALGQDDTNLYTVNQTNGVVTVVGPLGVAMSSPYAGLTFGPDGTLYAAINDQLYVIDKNTGAATLQNDVGADMGFASVSGLTYQSPQAPPPTKLVGISFSGNQLFTVETGSGTGGLIGTIGLDVSAYGLTVYSNTLYTFDPNTQAIVIINPTTGAFQDQISIGVSGLQGEGDLAIRADGVGFLSTGFTSTNATATNGLYTFNLTAGTSQLIGSTAVTIDALAFDSRNILYALGQDDTNLYIVNQTNGALTVVGPLGIGLASPYAGMTFSPEGVLYAAINDSLYTINKNTGTATAVSTNSYFGFDSVSGLAFAPAPPPIPFFNGQESLGDDNFYLQGSNGFGYYTLFFYPTVYHYDLGFEYFIAANDAVNGAYLYDYSSGTFFYTAPKYFPYLYDFTLNSWLYYYPDPARPGHYSMNPRYFYDFNTGQIITK